MMTSWRRPALAVALNVMMGAGVAAAQTVLVKNAPAGAPLEVAFNATRVASGTAGQAGDATLSVKIPLGSGGETDVRVFLDSCADKRRIVLVDRVSLPPTPDAGCERRDVAGLYVVKSGTTLMVDVGRGAVWLRQGAAPREWLLGDEVLERPAVRRPASNGFYLFGGGGLSVFRLGVTDECGTLSDCTAKNHPLNFTAGAGIWITRFLALEAGYARPRILKASGTATGYSFNSSLDTEFFTATAKGGIPVGPVRFYGLGGVNYHRSATTRTETIDSTTVTIDGVETTVPGGTQGWTAKTKGTNWVFGGGIEVWASRMVGIYGEVTRIKVKGSGPANTPPGLDDRATFLVGGIRLHIGR